MQTEHSHVHETLDCIQEGKGTRYALNISIALPEGSECHSCSERLQERLRNHKGISASHVQGSGSHATLCVHYDPSVITLESLERDVKSVGGELNSKFKHVNWDLHGMDCGDCANTIEHVVGRAPGVNEVTVNYAAEKMRVEFDGSTTSIKQIRKKVEWLGYHVHDSNHHDQHGHDQHGHDHDGHDHEGHDHPGHDHGAGMKSAIASGVLLAIGFSLETFTEIVFLWILPIYLASFAFGGYDASKHGLKAALKLRFDIEFLMVVAAIGAAILGAWAEGALLLFLFSLGHALEHMAMDKARNAMNALGEITPKTAMLQTSTGPKEVAVGLLKIGDTVLVRAGERMPVDGKVTKGTSALDQAAITGESVPVDVAPDSPVFAGSVNGEGTLQVATTKLAADSTISRIIKLVEEAQTQKSTTQRFTDSFSKYFVPISLIFVALVILVPTILSFSTGSSFVHRLALSPSDAFLRGMTILVAASPCALAISTPAAVLSGIAQAARNGVLVKGGAHLENLGIVKTVAFDKTGTLTRGKPKVTDVIAVVPESELLAVAATAESASSHPIAEAIVAKATELGLEIAACDDSKALPGHGFEANVGSDLIRIGKPGMFQRIDETTKANIKRLESEGKTVILVEKNHELLGTIAVADEVRPEAIKVIKQLKRQGVQVAMLTGDNEAVANAVGKSLGIDRIYANLLPEEKVNQIKKFAEQGPVAMVGDGINDAPAMASATVGIAMAARGTDVAMETADIALMADNLDQLPFALGISRGSRKIIKQNLFASLGTIAFLIPFALFGLAGIGIAIVFHEGSTLLVVANALRLLKFGGNQ